MNEDQYEKALLEFADLKLAKSDKISELSIERIKLNDLIKETRDREKAYRQLNDSRKDECAKKASDLGVEVESITKQIYDLRSEINGIDLACEKLAEIKTREDRYSPMEMYRHKVQKKIH